MNVSGPGANISKSGRSLIACYIIPYFPGEEFQQNGMISFQKAMSPMMASLLLIIFNTITLYFKSGQVHEGTSQVRVG